MTDVDQTTLENDRLAPPPASPSDAAPKRKHAKGEKHEGRRHPWRDNIEAITMAIIMAVMLKYFIIEAYKIPTGSMQPTLMGNKDVQIFDRILVDKLSYHYRDPERFEVVVFKYPLDSSKNFIKRLVGIGPEELRILYGDLWHRGDESEPWKVLRRPKPVQRETWKALHPGEMHKPWKALPATTAPWTVEGGDVVANGPGSLRFPETGSVMDDYLDGYPLKIFRRMRAPRGDKVVGDLRVDGSLSARAGCTAVELEFDEGERRYVVHLPGPAAPADARPTIRIHSVLLSNGGELPAEEVSFGEPWRLPAERPVRFAAQNLDDLVSLEIDGETWLELEVPAANPNQASVQVNIEGAGAEMRDLMVYRDIYYTTDRVKKSDWKIPAGQYVMLGDNTQDSSDSREWQWARYRWPGVEDVLRGNLRKRDPDVPNPWFPSQGVARSIYFRDEHGELHSAPWGLSQGSPEELEPEHAPFVPRELVTGRAVVVFWPFKWDLKLWRLRWIH